MFYLSLSFAGMFLLGSAIPTDNPNADPSWEQLQNQLGFVMPMLLFFALVAFVLQQLADRAERRYLAKVLALSRMAVSTPSIRVERPNKHQ